jgi:murein DD-endopeptidase MepM/ murein hydrolase activator NlpD
MRLRRLSYLIISLCAVAALGAGSATAETGFGPGTGIEPGTSFTPLAASTMTTPTAVLGTDGKQHIAYELLLTNATAAAAKVEKLEVRAPGVTKPLAKIGGSQLIADMTRLGGLPEGAPPAEATTIPAGSVGVVWLDVTLPATAAVPSKLEHRVTATLLVPKPFHFTADLDSVKTGTRAPLVLGPPLRSGTWVADEGCCSEPTHHRRGLAPIDGRLLVPQRFAIDWAMVDSHHRAWVGDPSKLSSYFGFGQPEIAAAPGTVVSAVDGIAENQPQGPLTELPPIQNTVGNHVILKVAPGRFLLYGHMKTGSVRVKVGQKVREGQLLGQVGNTGNSSTPHLHFQVLTEPTFFPSDSVPFTFAHFSLLGQVTDPFTDETLALQPTGTIPIAPSKAGGRSRRAEMPLDLNVIRFQSQKGG